MSGIVDGFAPTSFQINIHYPIGSAKLHQNMDSGTIIYLIIGAALLLFNFINSSNKQKKRREQEEVARQSTEYHREYETSGETHDADDWWRQMPPTPVASPPYIPSPVRKEFQSSLDLVANFDGESSLKSSIPVQDSGFANVYETKRRRKQSPPPMHPLVRDLLNDTGTDELRKGLVYSEILKQKF